MAKSPLKLKEEAAEKGAAASDLRAQFESMQNGGVEVAVSTSLDGGRRRAGMSFAREPTAVALADIAFDDFQALTADPFLIVRPIADGAAKAD